MKWNFLLITLLGVSLSTSAWCETQANDSCCLDLGTQAPTPIYNYEAHDAYRYFSVGVGPIIFAPNIGIGYRKRYSQFGWDAAVNVSTIGRLHQINAHLVGHYYLTSLEKHSDYMGVGLIVSEIFTNHNKRVGTMLSSDVVYGSEFKINATSKQFIELHLAGLTLSWINYKKERYLQNLPILYLKYGVKF